MNGDPDRPLTLTAGERAQIVEGKATCPFIGSAVAQDRLTVRNEVGNPLARIEEVRALGNTGGAISERYS